MSRKQGICNSKLTLKTRGSLSTPQSGASYYPIYTPLLPTAPSYGALSYTWSPSLPSGAPSNRLDEHLSDPYGRFRYASLGYAQMVYLTSYSGPVEKSQHSSKAMLSTLIFSAITDSDFDQELIREIIDTLVHPCDGLGVADSVFHALR